MLKDLDNKKKIELTITSIGIVFLIVMAISHMPKHKNNKPVSESEPFSGSGSVVASYTSDERQTTAERNPELLDFAWDKLRQGTSDKKWGRDPFLMDSNSAVEQDIGDLILSGIALDKDNPYAIINNEIVKLGDKVSGMTVIEINEKNVVLDENGQRHTLELSIY